MILSFNAPKLWNNLDSETKQVISLSIFQLKVFNFYMALTVINLLCACLYVFILCILLTFFILFIFVLIYFIANLCLYDMLF